jgi:hypothetical protein
MNNEDLKCFYNIQNNFFINNVKTSKANILLTTYCAMRGILQNVRG